jgi:hypothetical protein
MDILRSKNATLTDIYWRQCDCGRVANRSELTVHHSSPDKRSYRQLGISEIPNSEMTTSRDLAQTVGCASRRLNSPDFVTAIRTNPKRNITTICDVGHRALFGLAANCEGRRIELRHIKEDVMRQEHLECMLCGSVNLRKFIGDMSLRSPGLENIDMPPVVLSPVVFVCLDCCTAEFAVGEDDLRLLVQSEAGATDCSELILCGGRHCD